MAFEGSPGQRALHEAFPPEYHQVLFPPEPDPPFEDPGELAATWGQVWGASDEVGVLRTVLVRRPGDDHAEHVLAMAHQTITPESRRIAGFDQPIPVRDDASALDRLVAFTGRDPSWA